MAVRFVRIKGSYTPTPAVVKISGSGTIFRGSVVEFNSATKRVEPATSGTTVTSIFGVALDYIQGASYDTYIRVIPFQPGQLWEVDCTSTVNTAHIMTRHSLTNSVTLANSSVDKSAFTGVFLAHTINTVVANTLIGEFIRIPYFDKNTGAAYI